MWEGVVEYYCTLDFLIVKFGFSKIIIIIIIIISVSESGCATQTRQPCTVWSVCVLQPRSVCTQRG